MPNCCIILARDGGDFLNEPQKILLCWLPRGTIQSGRIEVCVPPFDDGDDLECGGIYHNVVLEEFAVVEDV